MARWFFATLLVAAGSVAVAAQAGVDPYRWIEQVCTPYFTEQYRLASHGPKPHDYFLAELRAARNNLEQGKVGLRECSQHVEDVAQRHFPSYLTMVNLTSEGNDLEEKIAYQLVEQIRDHYSADSMTRLERELQQMVTH